MGRSLWLGRRLVDAGVAHRMGAAFRFCAGKVSGRHPEGGEHRYLGGSYRARQRLVLPEIHGRPEFSPQVPLACDSDFALAGYLELWVSQLPVEEKKLKEIKTENEQLSPSGVDTKENSRDDKKSELPTRRGSQSRKSRNEKDIKEKDKIESSKDGIITTTATGPVQQDLNENEVKKEIDSVAPKVSDDERRFREEKEKKQHTVVFSSQVRTSSTAILGTGIRIRETSGFGVG